MDRARLEKPKPIITNSVGKKRDGKNTLSTNENEIERRSRKICGNLVRKLDWKALDLCRVILI